MENRRNEREMDPKRFGIRPTLGEKCLRRPPGQAFDYTRTEVSMNNESGDKLEDQSEYEKNTILI